MKTASLNEIKTELHSLAPETLASLCLRLGKYKKGNKTFVTYLIFEAHREQDYVEGVKAEVDELFTTLPTQNLYLIKKVLRKILRFVNRQIKYSGIKQTEIELRIYFCSKVNEAHIPLTTGTVLFNLYQQQLSKIRATLAKLPEDLQFDYEQDIEKI